MHVHTNAQTHTCAALGTDAFGSFPGRLFQKQCPSTWSGQIDQIRELGIIEGGEKMFKGKSGGRLKERGV